MPSPTSSNNQPLVKRLALFSFLLLILFYVVSAVVQARDNHRLLQDQSRSLDRTSHSLDAALADLKVARAERMAIIRIALAQNAEIKRLGGKPIDVLGVGAATPQPSSSPQRTQQPSSKPSHSAASPGPAASRSVHPSPRPTIKPRPTPTPTGLACVDTPIGKQCTPILTTNSAVSYNAALSTEEGGKMIDLDPHLVVRLVGLLLPLIVALVTKRWASSGVKAVTNLVLSAATAALTLLVDDSGHYNTTLFVNTFLDTFITSVVSYSSIMRPTGLAGTVAVKTEGFGIGGPPPTLQTDDVGAETPGNGGGVY